MCGFLCIADARGVRTEAAEAALDGMALRGPDDRGSLHLPLPAGGSLFLGHRRLSILGLGEAGHQPYRRGRVLLVFNGEIYNYLELREELRAEGVEFSGANSDTEVLAAGLERHGRSFLERLNGMFAGVALFEETGELLLFRDPAGQKPLYLHRSEGLLIASSEPRGILSYKPLELDRRRTLRGFLLGYHAEGTTHAGLECLPPGHSALFPSPLSPFAPEPYAAEPYTTRQEPETATLSHDEEGLSELLQQSVERHLRSDVPVGLYLSGGIDSTLVLHALAARGVTPTCFTIGFRDATADETPWARRAAEHYGAPLRVRTVDVPDLETTLGILDYFDEPFYDSSAIPTAILNGMASEEVKVVLGGDGGDELFCGYRRYVHTLRLQDTRSRPLEQGLLQLARSCGPRRLRTNKFLANASYPPVEALFRNSHDLSLLRFLEDPAGVYLDALASYASAFPTGGKLTATDLYRGDVHSYLSGDILTKADRCSMMSSIEQRAPLLDAQLVRFSEALPHRAKVRRGEGKALLKQIIARELGSDFAYRRKQGFVFPLRRLLTTHEAAVKEILRDGLSGGPVDASPLLHADLATLTDAELSGVWRCFVLARFQLVHSGRASRVNTTPGAAGGTVLAA